MGKKTIYITLLIILVFLAGFFLGSRTRPADNLGSVSKGQENTFQAGWEAARQRLSETGFYPPVGDVEIKSVSGKIEKLSGDVITVKIAPIDPLADPSLDTRTVRVTENTKIYKQIAKDPETYQRELGELSQKISGGTSGEIPAPPAAYDRQEANLSDIQTGQTITVIAATDIKTAKQFEAVEIAVQ